MRFKPDGLSPNAWAVSAGVSRTVWADMRRHGNPSRRTLQKLLAAVNSSLAEFEALRLGPDPQRLIGYPVGALEDVRPTWTPAALPPLPLVASAFGGDWGEPSNQIELIEIRPGKILDRLPRPASLAGDPEAYAVTTLGNSMWPRFRPGRRIAVSPRAPVAIGDDVLVRLRTPPRGGQDGVERVLIKQLVNRNAEVLHLRQFSPDIAFHVGAYDVEAIFKVPGELI